MSSGEGNGAANGGGEEGSKSRLTVLDRSLVVLVPSPDDTPSRKCGVTSRTERLHRLHGTSILAAAWKLLPQEKAELTPAFAASCYATSCAIFHRYYHAASLTEDNVWSVAMAAALLASKLDSHFDLSVARLILVFHHVYNRRVLRYEQQEGGVQTGSTAAAAASDLSHVELLRPAGSLSPMGPVYREWSDAVVQAENQILRKLGFVLYWIPDQHAHKYLPSILDFLLFDNHNDKDDNGNGKRQKKQNPAADAADADSELFRRVGQRAWNYGNDSYRLDLATRYGSALIACAAVHLACLDCDFYRRKREETAKTGSDDKTNRHHPGVTAKGRILPWWEEYVCGRPDGTNTNTNTNKTGSIGIALDFITVCNALLGLQQTPDDDDGGGEEGEDLRRAALGFVPSLEPEGSFNDPGSFLWEMTTGRGAISG